MLNFLFYIVICSVWLLQTDLDTDIKFAAVFFISFTWCKIDEIKDAIDDAADKD